MPTKKPENEKRFSKTFMYDGRRIYCYGKTEAEAAAARAVRQGKI